MRKKTLQFEVQFEETKIIKKVERQMTDKKMPKLLKQVLKDQIPQIQQLSTEELKKLEYTVTHQQQLIVTELIQQLITTKIEPEIPQAWQQNKDTWIQEQVKKEIEQPIILAIQPLKIIHGTREERKLIKKIVEGLLNFIRERQNDTTMEETTRIISINNEKHFADSIKHQKFQLQQIQERMQQIKEIKNKAKGIQLKACDKEVVLDSLQQEAKKVEQQAQQKEWDEYYMGIACLAALRSKDPKTPVSLMQHIEIIYMYYTL